MLKRIARDPSFIEWLIADARAALSGYRLGADDLDIVAAAVTARSETLRSARQEARRSALVELLTGVVAADPPPRQQRTAEGGSHGDGVAHEAHGGSLGGGSSPWRPPR